MFNVVKVTHPLGVKKKMATFLPLVTSLNPLPRPPPLNLFPVPHTLTRDRTRTSHCDSRRTIQIVEGAVVIAFFFFFGSCDEMNPGVEFELKFHRLVEWSMFSFFGGWKGSKVEEKFSTTHQRLASSFRAS